MYDYVIVTHLPAFYKVNLYNELAKNLKIFVIFVGYESEQRTPDFIDLACSFDYQILNKSQFESRRKLHSLVALYNTIKKIEYKKAIVGGWDLIEFWAMVVLNKKSKNCLALESTVLESNSSRIKGLIKKFYLSRISTVFASGKLHTALLEKLNYSGVIKVTHGVGLINKPVITNLSKSYRKKYLYLGRLSPEKNLNFLINVFNKLPHHNLTLVGSGPLEHELKSYASENIVFLPHIENKNLAAIFAEHDLLILCSISETWGLVVEEALYHGLPVIVSQNCGVSELVENSKNGFLFSPFYEYELFKIISRIDEIIFTELFNSTSRAMIDLKDENQVEAYYV